MNNKVLIKLYVSNLDMTYDLFIPVNETIFKVKKLIVKSFKDFIDAKKNSRYLLINKNNSRIYKNDEIVINTDIRNASELILVFYV